jgi:hypothetical protein
MSNYGLHIQQIVSDAHNAVTNLTERGHAGPPRPAHPMADRRHSSAAHQ